MIAEKLREIFNIVPITAVPPGIVFDEAFRFRVYIPAVSLPPSLVAVYAHLVDHHYAV